MSGQYSPRGFSVLPPVVKHLLILNGLFFLATLTFAGAFNFDLSQYMALHYPASDKFSPYQYVTYMFMHANFAHIFFNMFALWMFGYALENIWGSQRFLIYYIVTGLGAAFIQTFVNYLEFSSIQSAIDSYTNSPDPEAFALLMRENFEGMYNHSAVNEFIRNFRQNPGDTALLQRSYEIADMFYQKKISTPTVGASGAVYGILLAFGMIFPNVLIYIYFLFPIKAKYLVMFLGGIELYTGIASNPGDNVAHFAHLGGMIFGYVMIRMWKNKTNQNRFF
ncbi:MAG: rhomboid family intramembrane serine protease [Bacteroidales bacterium]